MLKLNIMLNIKASFFIIIFSAYPDFITPYKDLQLAQVNKFRKQFSCIPLLMPCNHILILLRGFQSRRPVFFINQCLSHALQF